MQTDAQIVPSVVADTDELRKLIRLALRTRHRTMAMVALAIRRQALAGEALLRAKCELEHGQFRNWLTSEGIVGEENGQVSYRTVQKWMKLARFHELHPGELDRAASVRQAYVLAGLLPEPDPSEGGRLSRGGNLLNTVIRLTTSILEELKARPLELMSPIDKKALRKRLDPLVELHEQLQET